MAGAKRRYVVNESGRNVAVLLDIGEYNAMLGALEQLESIRAYDEAKESGDDTVPFDEAVAEIEQHRP